MFGWRRRNDGFEWREYVRTTILVRRKDRRERLGRAGKVAVDGIKVAGQRGAEAGAIGAQALGRGAKVAGQAGAAAGIMGAQALGRGAKVAGQRGAAIGVVGAQALGRGAQAAGRHGMVIGAAGMRASESWLRSGLPKVWAALQVVGAALLGALAVMWRGIVVGAAWLGSASARGLAPLFAAAARALEPIIYALRQPSIGLPLAVAGSVALLGAAARVATKGLDRDTVLALLAGLGIVLALLVARYADGAPDWVAAPLRRAGAALRRGLSRLRGALAQLGPLSQTSRRRVAIAAAILLVAGLGWLAWEEAPVSLDLVTMRDDASAIQGRAVALSGDTLRVAGTNLKLAGIEAPADGQVCVATKSRRWRCDASAEAALSRLVRSRRVVCTLSGSDDHGNRLAKCRVGETDVGAALVRGGHVFANAGLFAPYRSLENEAREAKAGVWSGEPVRPSDYRVQKWDEASRDAPDGCPIKGSVKRGRRVYVLPWTRGYERVRISVSRGDRWFCSEAEARAAGWKPSEQS